MPFPGAVDAAIKQRFRTLIDEGVTLRDRIVTEHKRITDQGRGRGALGWSSGPVFVEEFQSLRTRALSLIAYLGSSPHLQAFADEVRPLEALPGSMEVILGTVQGLSSDYETGFLDQLLHRIEAAVAADYLGQAERLLDEGGSGNLDHVPAAVLFGAILENGLRALCARQTPPVALNNNKGDPKTMGTLVDDLKKAGAFNELKAKQLRSWADIRNAAAHGKFDAFKRSDVETLRQGVTSFLADYLG